VIERGTTPPTTEAVEGPPCDDAGTTESEVVLVWNGLVARLSEAGDSPPLEREARVNAPVPGPSR
jgi:hypothetical protein